MDAEDTPVTRGRPLLSLVMIVKDEAETIRQVLEAAKPHIDCWTILDTGSTDGTQGIVREVMLDVPGTLHEEPFVDFATSRNRVLDLDADAHDAAMFSLMLSGDEYLRGGEALRQHLEAHRDSSVDCHFVRLVISDSQFFSPRVLRVGSGWRYVGVVHETPMNSDPNAPKAKVDGAAIEHRISDEERRLASVWERHIPLLEAQVEQDPLDGRALFFLGQSYATFLDLVDQQERAPLAWKAMGAYLRRLDLSPKGSVDDELERKFTLFRYLDCARHTKVYTAEEFYRRCADLAEAMPNNAQAALLLVHAAMPVIPAAKVYELARKAANAGEQIDNLGDTVPMNLSVAWKAHLVAARAAQLLSAKFPTMDTGGGLTYADRMREHATAGVACGGPWEAFQQFTGGFEAAE